MSPHQPAPQVICPQCFEIILRAERCPTPNCGWKRPIAGGSPGSVAWSTPLNSAIGSQLVTPACLGNTLAFPTSESEIIALDLYSGSPLWKHTLGQHRLTRKIAASPSGFVCTTLDIQTAVSDRQKSEILLLHPGNGKPLARHAIDAPNLSSLALDGDLAWFYTSNNQLVSFQLGRGEITRLKPSFPSATQWSQAEPYAGDGWVVLSGGPGFGVQPQAVALHHAQVQWRYTLANGSRFSPAVAGNYACLVSGMQHLVCLDLESGIQTGVWEIPRQFTSQPVIHRDVVYAGVQLPQHRFGVQGYALKNNALAWEVLTDSAVLIPPVFTGDAVLICQENGLCRMVDLAHASICWEFNARDHLRSLPCISGSQVILGTQPGKIYSIFLEDCTSQEDLLPPASYLQAGEYELAGASYALLGENRLAAENYLRAHKPLEAIVFYYACGEYALGQSVAHQAGLEKSLIQLSLRYQRLEDLAAVDAPALSGLPPEKLEELARSTALKPHAAKFWLLAAEEWFKRKEYGRAGRAYLKAGQDELALRAGKQIPDKVRRLDFFLRNHFYAAAGETCEELKQKKPALDCYLKANLPEPALRLAEELEIWETVAHLAQQLNLHEKAGHAWARAGQHQAAATAFELAASILEQQLKPGEVSARVAELCQLAISHTNEDLSSPEALRQLRGRYERHNQVPKIIARISAPDHVMIVDLVDTIQVHLKNVGWGRARSITVEVEKEFSPRYATLPNRTLEPEAEITLSLSITPKNPEKVGLQVPVEFSIFFLDRQNRAQSFSHTVYLAVARSIEHAKELRSLRSPAMPEQLVISGGNVFLGPVDQSHTTKDTVIIGHGRASLSSEDSHLPEFCNECGLSLAGLENPLICPRCGKSIQ